MANKTHVCPHWIFSLFIDDPDTARDEAIKWIETLELISGDFLILPSAKTGDPVPMVYNAATRPH